MPNISRCTTKPDEAEFTTAGYKLERDAMNCRTWFWVVVAIASLEACRNRQNHEPAPRTSAPLPVPTDTGAAVAVRAADAAVRAPDAAPRELNAAWFGDAPRLPSELKDINPEGLTIDALKKQGVALYECSQVFEQCSDTSVPGTRLVFFDDRDSHVIYRWELLTKVDVQPILQVAWGKPDACGRWVNRDRGLAVTVAEPWPMFRNDFASSLRYQPAAAWLVVAGILQPAAQSERKQTMHAALECADERTAIAATLGAALGEPVQEAAVTVWRDEARGLVVKLDNKTIAVEPYKSVATTLQAAKGTWSFESKRLLGTSWPELLTAYQAQAEAGPGVWQLQLVEEIDQAHHVVTARSGRITVPGQAELTLGFAIDRRNRVKGYVFILPYGNSVAVTQQLLALIKNRYGTGTPRPDDVEVTDLSASPRVWLRDHLGAQQFEIVVGAISEREYMEISPGQGL